MGAGAESVEGGQSVRRGGGGVGDGGRVRRGGEAIGLWESWRGGGGFWIVVGKHDAIVRWNVGEYSGLMMLWIPSDF